ncbi:MAG TPA: histidine kinase [Gaiellaceae bacterium]|nr:histidine kinase [Gaiellaceae bacterium]
MRKEENAYQSWLWGEVLLFGLLGALLALFVTYPGLRPSFDLPQVRLVLNTMVALAAVLVAVLAGVRFSVEGRRLDWLLCAGFSLAAGSTFFFGIAPMLGNAPLHRREQWALIWGRVLAGVLIAAAAFARKRTVDRHREIVELLLFVPAMLVLLWMFADSFSHALPALNDGDRGQPGLLTAALAARALASLLAVVGFGLRFRARGHDLDRWLALGATLLLFADLYYVLTPHTLGRFVSTGDFLRLLAYAVLLVGVWRAIRFAEFGRAVAEERARVAREIHDGLAQYLFAVSTHATMLENGADPETTLPQLKEAAAAAQQEARFAILALSSASGTAPFDAALRRYVDFLTADGELKVDLEIDERVRLAPDEQIEVFRIVQEGLGNARKHAGARHAEVRIGLRGDERVVSIVDDGAGFDDVTVTSGQGLRNMKARSASIGGGFRLRSRPGRGTALEVVLRA